jgi:hypothetical protein
LNSEGCGKKDRTADFSYSNLYKMEMMKLEGDKKGKKAEEIKK